MKPSDINVLVKRFRGLYPAPFWTKAIWLEFDVEKFENSRRNDNGSCCAFQRQDSGKNPCTATREPNLPCCRDHMSVFVSRFDPLSLCVQKWDGLLLKVMPVNAKFGQLVYDLGQEVNFRMDLFHVMPKGVKQKEYFQILADAFDTHGAERSVVETLRKWVRDVATIYQG